MRFLMIAAAMSVAALGFSGCAATGGCQSGTCGGDVVAGGCSGGGCSSGCTDCQASQAPEAAECGCGGGGCASCLSGIHGGAPGGYGGGLQDVGMGLTVFDRGSQCGVGCGKFGCGRLGLCLPCRARGGVVSESCDSCDTCQEEIIEEPASPGLLGRLKAANEIALAEQDAQFAAGVGCGCGIAGCDGIGCGAGLHGCGGKGCGLAGCKDCVRGVLQHAVGHPYGGAVPHTTPPQGAPPTGAAPTYAYPYYTTRGPRDFLAREPASIGY